MQAFPFDSKLTFDDHDNPIYDRAVSSQPLRKLIKELFTTGIMPNPSTNFQVSAGSDGMTVQVSAGFAVIDGGLCQETKTRTLEVTAADNTYDRIDTVVLRWNENVDVRNADLYVIAGTPAVNPVRPTLHRNNSIYEIGLADVFITKRVATITNDKITDTRYEAERCGIVSSISKFDTTTLYQQIQADLAGFKSTEQANFLTWYENIRNILDENAAGHLQNEIDDLKETVTSAINDLNNDLTKELIASQSGAGTKTVTLDVSNKKSIVCACKKSSTLIHCCEIPVALLTSGTVISLGKTAPVITTNMYETSKTTQTNTLGKKVDVTSDSVSGMPYTLLATENGTKIGNGFSTGNGLAADLSNTTDASITYNGNNSFTLNSINGLTVYLLA